VVGGGDYPSSRLTRPVACLGGGMGKMGGSRVEEGGREGVRAQKKGRWLESGED